MERKAWVSAQHDHICSVFKLLFLSCIVPDEEKQEVVDTVGSV